MHISTGSNFKYAHISEMCIIRVFMTPKQHELNNKYALISEMHLIMQEYGILYTT